MSAGKPTNYAKQLIEFVQASPSPFHTVDTVSKLLLANGYKKISERNDADWTNLGPNDKFFFTRNQTTVFAVAIGGRYVPGNGMTIAAAHTDSPVLRVKPISNISSTGVVQVGVETYGGGLWNTWFDRDLSLAGRVIVADDINDQFHKRLVNIGRPILTIPNLAIHLNRNIDTEGFKPNYETNMVPIIASEAKAALNCPVKSSSDAEPSSIKQSEQQHSPVLMDLLARELDCRPDQIRDFELSLYDCQPPCLGGAFEEFVFSPRLDNLGMSFCCVQGLINSEATLAADTNMRIVALFDHEEIGSESAQGAASNMMPSIINRLTRGVKMEAAIAKSFLVSADMAHACHPNYSDKHEARHRPAIHGGVVLKFNAKQRYATNSETSFIMKQIAKQRSIPLQHFVVRNDTGCGSTVGPILAAKTGMRTIDIGCPQLAMHSIREMCGVDDIGHGVHLLEDVFTHFPTIDGVLDQ